MRVADPDGVDPDPDPTPEYKSKSATCVSLYYCYYIVILRNHKLRALREAVKNGLFSGHKNCSRIFSRASKTVLVAKRLP